MKDRVDLHDRIHGARWGSFSIARMLSEIEEEGLDVGGWGVLLAQLPALLDLDDERVHDVRLLLQETMRHGAAITTLTEQIRGVLD